MPFIKELPQWEKAGTKPPASKLTAGWGAGDKPPADWWNWFQNRTYLALKELQENALHNEQRGVANGIATLGADGKVPASQLNVSSTGTAISIADAGNYYVAANAEGALQEVGAALNGMRGTLINSVNSLLGG